MALGIAMAHLVTALIFSIEIMFESCLKVFTDLKRTTFDGSKFYIQQSSRLELATEFCIVIECVTLLANDVNYFIWCQCSYYV